MHDTTGPSVIIWQMLQGPALQSQMHHSSQISKCVCQQKSATGGLCKLPMQFLHSIYCVQYAKLNANREKQTAVVWV